MGGVSHGVPHGLEAVRGSVCAEEGQPHGVHALLQPRLAADLHRVVVGLVEDGVMVCKQEPLRVGVKGLEVNYKIASKIWFFESVSMRF